MVYMLFALDMLSYSLCREMVPSCICHYSIVNRYFLMVGVNPMHSGLDKMILNLKIDTISITCEINLFDN